MSWQENIENKKFSIKTGDGKVFFPLWKNGTKSKEYNYAKYEFINKSGSDIQRKAPQGASFPLTFWFQGEDNIEQSDAFERSADDNRAWTISHPLYGSIIGQPIKLRRNDTGYNATEITVDFWESVLGVFPNSISSIVDEVNAKVDEVNKRSNASFEVNSNASITDVSNTRLNLIESLSKFKPDKDSYIDFINNYNAAVSSADLIVSDAQRAAIDFQNAYNNGVIFNYSVKNKVKQYISVFNNLRRTFLNPFEKVFFEAQGSTILSSVSAIVVNPNTSDYLTRQDVLDVNSLLINTYNDYLETLDNNQIDIYDVNDAYNPDVNIQENLYDLIYLTSQNLLIIAFGSKQKREIELTKDSNLIILTHRYLGLDANDENIETFRQINNIKLNELINIKKGRIIKYFV